MMSDNTTKIDLRPIDPNILSVLDITTDGKVVSAEDWNKLWLTVFKHLDGLSAFCLSIDELREAWTISEQNLSKIVVDFNAKNDALQTSFVHYGKEAPKNPHIKFWIEPVENLKDGIVTYSDLLQLQPASKIVYVTLNDTEWNTDNDNPHHHYQMLPNVQLTSNSKVDLNPTVEQLSIFYNKDVSFVTENDHGLLIVHCIGQKPTGTYTIQATVTEVALNG